MGTGVGHKSSAIDERLKYAAIDLGTNNCRLLVATAGKNGEPRIVDSFSRIVRLGQGVSHSGNLSEDAIDRTIAALKICASKVEQRGATSYRCIATQACRRASNGQAFLKRVKQETGLEFDIISSEEEARLSVQGCAPLLDRSYEAGLVFDIGGGSTELSWLRLGERDHDLERLFWASLPHGVVTLSEDYNGKNLTASHYQQIIDLICEGLSKAGDPANIKSVFKNGRAHFLGTSGTVTAIAGIHLGLPRYQRDKVDGIWLTRDEVRAVSERLLGMTNEERASQACISPQRADLVVCGCAILEALLLEWPVEFIRVADRGLREGILVDLINAA